MQDKPLGDLCVTFDPHSQRWAVVVCTGDGVHQPIKWCNTRSEGAEFALEEQTRRRRDLGVEVNIHFPDNCPCYCNFASSL